ncbi:MAG: hypothetical protein JSV23_04980 [Promethearchaeota archaeon]|nr:MAG: hypothetical protein JSV23_04980 [Candidatus Lokiarchaeota archaeon]
MELRKCINRSIIGLIGSIIIILSEFFSWFSDSSLMEIYISTMSVAIADAFLFIFPLMSGVICLIASILMIYKIELKIKSIIIFFVGLGFLIIFFIDYIRIIISYLGYLPNAGIGLYLAVVGFLLILINIINVLMTIEKRTDGN